MEIFRKYPALKWLLLWGGIIVLVVIGVHFFAKSGTSSASTTGPSTDTSGATEMGIAPTSSFNQNITVAGASGVGASGGGGSGSPGGSGGTGGTGSSGGGGHPGPGPHNPVDPLPGTKNYPGPGSWHPNVPYPAHGQIIGFAQSGADARQVASRPVPKQVITTGHDARQAVRPQPVRKAPAWLQRLPQRRLQGTQRSLNRMGA